MYRRLPNTDLARIRSLETALAKSNENDIFSNVISLNTFHEAEELLQLFTPAHKAYTDCMAGFKGKRGNTAYAKSVSMVRLYISHFLQVFLLSVVRGEISRKYKAYYGLSPEGDTLPDLSLESSLVLWGKNIIDGEARRVNEGGVPIYNPSIARVQVWYDQFVEAYTGQQDARETCDRALQRVAALRPRADALILNLWNQVENHFAGLSVNEKIKRCREYGLIYYERKDRHRSSVVPDLS